MKTATVREVQHNLSKILKWVSDGETVIITKHRHAVANLVPSTRQPRVAALPDFAGRARSIWKGQRRGGPISRIIMDDRHERL